MAKLGDICTVVSGSTPKTGVAEYWDGTVKWITPAELNEDSFYITDSVRHITEYGKEKTGLSYLPKGTVILSSRAPIGKTAIAGCEMCCNQGFKNLICSDAVYNEYLYFFLKSKTDYLNSLGRGATFKEISKSIVEKIEIPLPNIEKQHQIVKELKATRNLIAHRKQQLTKLDELIKARFVEMFGDPYTNSKDYPLKKGESFFKLSNGKAVPESKRLNGGIPAYGGNGISWYTDESLFDADTIVVGRVGFQSGNVHLVKGPLWVTDNAMYMSSCDFSQYNLTFLIELMAHVDFTKFQDAGDLKKITQRPFMQFEYLCPPLSLQNQFADFVAEVDKSKVEVQKALDQTQLLFDSLMQQYFG